MGTILSVYITPETERRLLHAAKQLGRGIEDIAESAVSEAALNWEKTSMPRETQEDAA